MRNRSKIIIIIIAIMAIMAGVYSYTSYENYQNITMEGLKCEVPVSDVNVTNASDYQIYDNSKYNLKIIVYDQQSETDEDSNQTIPTQFEELKNTAQNNITSLTKSNVTYNKSQTGLYSFYGNYSGRNVLITTTDENLMIHMLKTLKVEPLEVQDLENENETITDDKQANSNGDTKATTGKSSSKSTSKSKSSSSKGGSDDGGWTYSPQHEDYIKTYTSSDGVYHVKSKDGYRETYNPHTRIRTSRDKYGNTYSDRV